MGYTRLQRRFVNATQQERSPFDGAAVEWDYSRYARALGLTAMPGLHDLDHSGYAIAVAEPGRWAKVTAGIQASADDAGWSFHSVSAWPSVVVPDPVVYGLGRSVCGAHAPLWFRSGQGGEPARHERRGAGSSLAVSSGERWLIGADRVRRRLRDAIAERGHCVVVEYAEHLTPSALAILRYLIHAHAAWKARMLARPAKCFVLFVTAPESGERVASMLQRFRIQGMPHVWSPDESSCVAERDGPPNAPQNGESASGMTLDQEMLTDALAAAPALLTERDIRAVFGTSAVTTARQLVSDGRLRKRLERDEVVYEPLPSWAARGKNAAVEDRVLEAIRARYRVRHAKRHSHRHLVHAIAYMELRLGRPERAIRTLRRSELGIPALLPGDWRDQLEPHRQQAEAQANALDTVVRFVAAAQSCDYTNALHIATQLRDKDFRSTCELHRAMNQLFSAGRTHLDASTPADFWTSLNSSSIDGTVMDAVCILGELFARMRLMKPEDVIDRYRVLESGLARLGSQRAEPRVGALIRVMLDRVQATMPVFGVDENTQCCASTHLQWCSGYVCATHLYARAHRAAWSAVGPTHVLFGQALAIVSACGNPSDRTIQLTGLHLSLNTRGLIVYSRTLTDEVALLIDALDPSLRAKVVDTFRLTATDRLRSVAAVKTLQPGTASTDSTIALGVLAQDSAERGDLRNAHHAIRSMEWAKERDRPKLCWMLAAEASVLEVSLQWARLPEVLASFERVRPRLGSRENAGMDAYLRGLVDLYSRRMCLARARFAEAEAMLGTNSSGVLHRIQRRLVHLRLFVSTLLDHAECSPRPTLTSFLERAMGNWGRLSERLPLLVLALDHFRWRGAEDAPELLSVIRGVRQDADRVLHGVQTSLVQRLSELAPASFGVLRGGVAAVSSVSSPFADDVASLSSRLDTLDTIDETRTDVEAFDCSHSLGTTVDVPEVGRATSKHLRRAALDVELSVFWKFVESDAMELRVYGYLGDGHVPHCVSLHRARKKSKKLVARSRRLLGQSTNMKQVRGLITAAARSDVPVLITGESGTGKEVVARQVHLARYGPRASWAMIDGGIGDDLLPSRLFGHVRGAFTGAMTDQGGILDEAHGTTLFIDSIENMSARMQITLLRVLETGEYRPVGGRQVKRADFRLVCSTSQDLEELARSGRFRPDLYYRVCGVRIDLLPLRDRPEDIAGLARLFVKAMDKRLTRSALALLRECPLLGNARELKSLITRAALATQGRFVTADAVACYTKPLRSRSDTSDGAVLALERAALQGVVDNFHARDFARAAGVSTRSAQRHLSELLRRGALLKSGAGRATRYSQR